VSCQKLSRGWERWLW